MQSSSPLPTPNIRVFLDEKWYSSFGVNKSSSWMKKKLKYFSTLGLTHAELEILRFATKTPATLELNEKYTDRIFMSSIGFWSHWVGFTALSQTFLFLLQNKVLPWSLRDKLRTSWCPSEGSTSGREGDAWLHGHFPYTRSASSYGIWKFSPLTDIPKRMFSPAFMASCSISSTGWRMVGWDTLLFFFCPMILQTGCSDVTVESRRNKGPEDKNQSRKIRSNCVEVPRNSWIHFTNQVYNFVL